MPDLQGDGTFLEKVPVNTNSWYELRERGHLLVLFAWKGWRLH